MRPNPSPMRPAVDGPRGDAARCDAARCNSARFSTNQRDSAQPDAIARGMRRRSERRVIAAPTAIAALIAVSAARAAALRP
ncbi:hypothetical protein AQ808_06830 [Burkholderia pseudomallei]|nr:hypothetical protein UQ47_18685 [Burkholderia pseudomallei]EEC33824.1 conserved hypothetical protein [Burkholderia pseudomallei 576]ALC59268.1 hypothetical protein AMS56_20600 [Burkholderia pseudomallei]KIX41360.1 hypothetical protein SY87_27715 [Burkholderia pseudomallei]KJR92257.1 hypothetical protein VP95_18060 [Burkholderia pseudomallei]